jgi:hypothetical protein
MIIILIMLLPYLRLSPKLERGVYNLTSKVVQWLFLTEYISILSNLSIPLNPPATTTNNSFIEF